ncbi:MAG: hypothetical protein Q8P68_00150 [Candidatus Peregrinibacteria bacterium]|nr:hypothetical protein [Candidatus Peregrinibacteria bacterium]MDZ4244616.1 hypothetical protein [Candidatus Gracilibacteria bacterium]
MKKYIISFLALTILLILSSCGSEQPSEVKNIPEKTEPPIVKENIEPVQSLTDTKEGVETTITNIRTDGTNMALDVTFSNHVYDITSMDVIGLSSLNGVSPTDYIIGDTQMGGHHVEAEIRFPAEAKGKLVLGLNEEITFTFEL